MGLLKSSNLLAKVGPVISDAMAHRVTVVESSQGVGLRCPGHRSEVWSAPKTPFPPSSVEFRLGITMALAA